MELLNSEKYVLTCENVFVLTNQRIMTGHVNSDWRCAWLKDVSLVTYVRHIRWLAIWAGTACFMFGGVLSKSVKTVGVADTISSFLMVLGIGIVFVALFMTKREIQFCTSGGYLSVTSLGYNTSPQTVIDAYVKARAALETQPPPPPPPPAAGTAAPQWFSRT